MDDFYTPKRIEPRIVPSLFDKETCDTFLVDVVDSDYRICVERSAHRWSNTKTGHYGSGIINDENDPTRVERIGLLGEFALAKIFGLAVDLSYRQGGDKEDFIINDKRINMKTASKQENFGRVYHRNEKGKLVKTDCDYYVFGFLTREHKRREVSTVCLVGFASHAVVVTSPIHPGKGEHYNYDVPYMFLTCMSMFMPIIHGKVRYGDAI